jgi:hypothetical protein
MEIRNPTFILITVALVGFCAPPLAYADDVHPHTGMSWCYRLNPSAEQLQSIQSENPHFSRARMQPTRYGASGARRRIILGILIGAAAGGAFAAVTPPSELFPRRAKISLGMGLGAVAGGLIGRAWTR